MTDTLRTRIAAVLRSHWPGECTDTDEDESPIDHLADAVIAELNLAKACQGGCVWQIPSRVEDMTPEQRKLLGNVRIDDEEDRETGLSNDQVDRGVARCGAVLNLNGEHFPCDREGDHDTHGNVASGAIWCGAGRRSWQ